MVKPSSSRAQKKRRPVDLERMTAEVSGHERYDPDEMDRATERSETQLAALLPAIPPKPDWDDDEAMAAWLDAMLTAEEVRYDLERAPALTVFKKSGSVLLVAKTPEDYAIDQALNLNFEPIAKLLDVGASLHVQRWIAKRLREGGFAARTTQSDKRELLAAADDVPRIKRLWREHFGRGNRASGMKTTVEFAAERHSVGLHSLAKHLKRRTEKPAGWTPRVKKSAAEKG
jgi:hypothetical protein